MTRVAFIVGTQRSGTTLLCQMLNAHQDYFVLNEFWSVYPPLTMLKLPLSRLKSVLEAHLGFSKEQWESLWTEEVLAGAQEDVDGRFALFARAMQAKAEAAGAQTWGLKDPRLTYFLEPFRQHFPGARFVFIVRDPRAVCASYLKRRMNIANVCAGAQLWRQQVETQMRFCDSHQEIALCVRYEDLVNAPQPQLSRICEFLDVEMTDDLLRFHEQKPKFGVHSGNENVLRPLDPTIIEAWKNKLSAFQVGVIEGIASDLMEHWDYRAAGEPIRLSSPSKAWFAFHNWALTTYWWQRRSGWYGLRRLLDRK